MAQSVQNFANYESPNSASQSFSIDLGSGTGRKIVVYCGREATWTISSLDYNGTSGTQAVQVSHSGGAVVVDLWYVDVPDALGAGTYNVNATLSTSAAATFMAWQTVGSSVGAPEDTDTGEAGSEAATVSGAGLTTSAGSLVIAGVLNSAATPTWDSWGGGLVERQENNEAGMTSASADFVNASGGAITPSATASSTSTNKVLAAISIAASAGATTYPQNRGLLLGTGTIGQGNGFGYKRF